MAAITVAKRAAPRNGAAVIQYYGTSTSNQADTLTTTAVEQGSSQRLLYVTVAYDGSPTYTGTALTITLDSGIDSIYDVTLAVGADNTRYTFYQPDEELWLVPGDAILVAAPAGGSGREASIVVCLEKN